MASSRKDVFTGRKKVKERKGKEIAKAMFTVFKEIKDKIEHFLSFEKNWKLLKDEWKS